MCDQCAIMQCTCALSETKRATNYRALLQKMTYEDKASYDCTPACRCVLCSARVHCLKWKEPLIIRLFCRKWHMKIRHPMTLNPSPHTKEILKWILPHTPRRYWHASRSRIMWARLFFWFYEKMKHLYRTCQYVVYLPQDERDLFSCIHSNKTNRTCSRHDSPIPLSKKQIDFFLTMVYVRFLKQIDMSTNEVVE